MSNGQTPKRRRDEMTALPNLIGSEKQIAWATEIRADYMARVDRAVALVDGKMASPTISPTRLAMWQAVAADIAAVAAVAFAISDAAKWIDARDGIYSGLMLLCGTAPSGVNLRQTCNNIATYSLEA